MQTWGGNLSALRSNSLVTINADYRFGILPFTPQKDGRYSKASVSQVALGAMVNGEVQSATSPCGTTCSYRISVDAPYFSCNKNSTGKQANTGDIIEPIFSARWGPGFSNTYNPDPGAGFIFTTLTADAAIPNNDSTQWLLHGECLVMHSAACNP